MKRVAPHFVVLAAAVLMAPAAANAQLFRAYLASYGVDTNVCSVGQPCRLLPAALNAVASGGEIWMLDSANFNAGTVTVSKNVKLLAVPGQLGSIVAVAGGPALIINPGFNVSLQNVSITTNATSPGTDGIQMTTGVLSVQDSVFSIAPENFAYAIRLSGSGSLSVHNSVFRDSYVGVYVAAGGKADLSSSKFFNIFFAIYADGTTSGTTTSISVRDCAVSGPGGAGLNAAGPTAGAEARITVHNTSVSTMSHGMAAYGPAGYLGVSNSAVSGSSYGLISTAGGVIESLGNNLVRNNTTNTSGPITVIPGS